MVKTQTIRSALGFGKRPTLPEYQRSRQSAKGMQDYSMLVYFSSKTVLCEHRPRPRGDKTVHPRFTMANSRLPVTNMALIQTEVEKRLLGSVQSPYTKENGAIELGRVDHLYCTYEASWEDCCFS